MRFNNKFSLLTIVCWKAIAFFFVMEEAWLCGRNNGSIPQGVMGNTDLLQIKSRTKVLSRSVPSSSKWRPGGNHLNFWVRQTAYKTSMNNMRKAWSELCRFLANLCNKISRGFVGPPSGKNWRFQFGFSIKQNFSKESFYGIIFFCHN